ncbi:Peroxisomal membrane protein like [Actinidia chinensis var. chinensis]|uniref:Peroxisomal membrane protein like n=1 Tax=Actinidia chinensis var. chinensis TaxID=1590841 RepID=A0A2R6RTK0_ACTCC|nr:Peroxisomal membrane protein like [Actinidia chinensis var. chinensis]
MGNCENENSKRSYAEASSSHLWRYLCPLSLFFTQSLLDQGLRLWYVGNIGLKIRDLKRIAEDEACVRATIEIAIARGDRCVEEEAKIRKLREKEFMKKLSVVQDLADELMALDDVRDG